MMKKTIVTTAMLAIAGTGFCQTAGRFDIKGTLMGGADGDTIIIASPKSGPVDTVVVRKGTFSFAGEIDGAELFFIIGTKGGRPAYGSSVVAEPGVINVRLYNDPDREADVVGNMTNSLWRLFSTRENELMTEAQPYVREMKRPTLSPQQRKTCQSVLDSLTTLRMKNVVDFVSDNSKTLAADVVFELYSPMLNEQDFGTLSALLSKNSPQLPGYRRAVARAEQEAIAHRTEIGRKFTDFECADKDGKMVKLSDIVKANKVTLLDFWASWCGPCRMEMPTVKRAYEAFKAKGLEVVGVSLDNKKEAWLGAVKTLGMGWIQLSDLKGWQCEPAQTYGVHSIPSCILIAQDGTILAKDLRGEQLIMTLMKVLK